MILKAIQKIKDADIKSKKKMMIFLTDGEFTDEEKWSELKAAVQGSDVRIHTVAIEAR